MCFRQLFRPKQGSTDRQVRGPIGPSWSEIFKNLLVLVRFGPRFSKICWSWSGSVRDFQKFFGPGPVRSEIFKKFLVLVRFGPRFSKIFWSWSGSVRDFQKSVYSLKPHPFWIKYRVKIKPFLKPHSVSMRNWVAIGLITETAFVSNAESGKNWDIC